MASRFPDRRTAGSLLAEALSSYRSDSLVLLALPRGGVAVGAPIAQAWGVRLYPLIVRKLASPAQPEVAFGAIAEGSGIVVDPRQMNALGLQAEEVEEILAAERAEMARRRERYAVPGRPALAERTVILVDDGMATGLTMIAGIRAVKREGAARVIAAIPVASTEACGRVLAEGAECVCVLSPPELRSVGAWYEEFEQLGDEEVSKLLQLIPS